MDFRRFQVAVAMILLFYGTVYGDDYWECPDPGSNMQSMITNFISVDNRINGTTICRMEYIMPEGATLWQGMLAANRQHGDNFTFEAIIFSGLGHFITTVNGVTAAPSYFWALFAGNGVATSYGADSVFPKDDESYIWNYQYYNSSGTNHKIANYTDACLNAPSIPPSMPMTYAIGYLTVSSENTANYTNGTSFKPVCQQLVLFDSAERTLSDVLATASEQVPLKINVVLVETTYEFPNGTNGTESVIVSSLNYLPNQDGFVWTPYNASSNTMLSRDVSSTSLSDGDHIVFRFVEESLAVTTMTTTVSSATRTAGARAAIVGLMALVIIGL